MYRCTLLKLSLPQWKLKKILCHALRHSSAICFLCLCIHVCGSLCGYLCHETICCSRWYKPSIFSVVIIQSAAGTKTQLKSVDGTE